MEHEVLDHLELRRRYHGHVLSNELAAQYVEQAWRSVKRTVEDRDADNVQEESDTSKYQYQHRLLDDCTNIQCTSKD